MSVDKFSIEQISKYYRDSDWLYRVFWYGQESLGLHFGIDSSGARKLDDSVKNQYEIIIKNGSIKKGMKILDAGCGVGGGAMYIAKKTGAHVYGVSISDIQINKAKKLAKVNRVEEMTSFEVMDYTKMRFSDNYFDVIYGIESVCHALPKTSFLDEAYRVLKPGGKLILSDGYLIRKTKNKTEVEIVDKFCIGWKLGELAHIDDMKSEIVKSGYEIIEVFDATNRLELSKARFRFLVLIGRFFTFLPGVYDNVLAIKNVLKGLDVGMMGYFVIVARKK